MCRPGVLGTIVRRVKFLVRLLFPDATSTSKTVNKGKLPFIKLLEDLLKIGLSYGGDDVSVGCTN